MPLNASDQRRSALIPPLGPLAALIAEGLGHLDQRGRMLQLDCALPALTLIPERMVLREAISRPFELVVHCLSTTSDLELMPLLGEQIAVRLLQPDGTYKTWHGHVFEASQLGSDGGLSRYRVAARAWLGFLELGRDSFIWQGKTAIQIIEDVFQKYTTASFRFEVTEPMRVRRTCTQYRESDFDFVSRLLAEEGLSYHFEHLQPQTAAAPGALPGAAPASRAALPPNSDNAAAQPSAARSLHTMVITDRTAPRPSLGTARYAARHVVANQPGQRDSVTLFESHQRTSANAVTLGAWNDRQVKGIPAQESSGAMRWNLPTLEVYDGYGADRYGTLAEAQRAAGLALDAFEGETRRFDGQGSTRHFEPGRTFRLIDHPLFGANLTGLMHAAARLGAEGGLDNEFTLIAVEHQATNNLGASRKPGGLGDLEHGTYTNRFHAVPAATPIVPRHIRKPTAKGLQTALVVGVEPLSDDRDLRVRVKFAWERDEQPLPGGLARADSARASTAVPSDDQGGAWVRCSVPSAGANWGAALVPRVGTEVAVEAVEGDIDSWVVIGQLHNGQDLPPFSAGEDSGANHPGVLSGGRTHAGDGAAFNEWTIDDSTGQLRMRLATSHFESELNLGHHISQAAGSSQRGAWTGAGFMVNTRGWIGLHADKGVLLSTWRRDGTYGSAEGTQMDAAEGLRQMKDALAFGKRLGSASKTSTGLGMDAFETDAPFDAMTQSIEPKKQGRGAEGPGQTAQTAQGAPAGEPGESFSQPLVMLNSASAVGMTSAAGIAGYAGQDLGYVCQGDLQQTAAHTYASVSGATTSLYAHAGGIQAVAANGPVSLRAHTDALSILADKQVTIVSVNDEIRIRAKSKIELVAGESSVVLEGANITFMTPGKFEVKGSTHAFLGGANGTTEALALPDSRMKLFDEAFVVKYEKTGEVIPNQRYRIKRSDGTLEDGTTNALGETHLVTSAEVEELEIELLPPDELA